MARRRLVEGRGDHLALDRALHVGDFLRPLVDQQHDQVAFGVVGGDRVGDVLQQHRLAGARRRHDQRALALADRRDDVDDAGRKILLGRILVLHAQPLVGIERREVVEVDLVAGLFGVFEVDGVDFEKREIAFALLRAADLALDGVAGAQAEAADLRGRDIDVVGAGQVVRLRARAGSRSRPADTSTTPSPMMSISFWASCLRIANINSCLRMVEAFSTLCSSAKPSNSMGDLDLRSWSFISRMRVILWTTDEKYADRVDGREGIAGLWRSGDAKPLARYIGWVPVRAALENICLRSVRWLQHRKRYGTSARVRSCRNKHVAAIFRSKRLDHHQDHDPIMRSVGTSLMIR